MLQWRARAYAMRDGFADCLMDLAIREEVEDLTPEPVVTDSSFLDDAVLEPVEGSSGSQGSGQRALPIPTEEALPGIVIEQGKPKDVVEVAKEGASMVAQPENDNTEPAQTEPVKAETLKPETAAIPSIEINKPMGAKSPNWVRTREHLITGFLELNTREACGQFRKRHSATINQLRTNAKDEWDIY